MNSVQAGVDCANCGAHLAGPYCAACGQVARPPNPTVRDVLQDIAGELFDYDGRVFQSVRLLFAHPGFLTREAFADRRVSYVSPLRLYLIFSVLFFAVLAFTPNLLNVTLAPKTAAALDPAAAARLTAEIRAAVNDATNRWIPRLMFLLMPIFAALVMLVRRKSGRNYPQHLYFAMHVHAVAFFAATIGALASIVAIPYLPAAVKYAALAFAVLHAILAFRRAYETTVWGTLWRTAIVSALYFVVTVAGLLGTWFPAVWGAINQPH